MKRLPKTSEDIFIYLAYPLFVANEIKEILKPISGNYIRRRANYFGVVKYKTKPNKNKNNWRGYQEISGKFFGNMKKSARERNYDFFITIEELWSIFLQQNGKCYYTGLNLKIGNGDYGKFYRDIGNTSVDRIDSSKGYTINNLAWVHKDINTMKLDFSHVEFIKICQEIYNHQNNPIITTTKEFEDFIPRNAGAKKTYKGHGQISGKYFYNLKKCALKRKHSFNITIKEIWELFIKQNGQCVYSGRDLIIPNKDNYGKKSNIPGNASLDRIDSTKGYTIDNIQWVDKDINFMKHKLTNEKFLHYIKLIVENTRNKQ